MNSILKMGIFIMAVALTTPAFAGSNQNHTCQGGHNCTTGGSGSGGSTNSTNTNSNTNSNSNANTNANTSTSDSNSTSNNLNASNATGGQGGAGGAGGQGGQGGVGIGGTGVGMGGTGGTGVGLGGSSTAVNSGYTDSHNVTTNTQTSTQSNAGNNSSNTASNSATAGSNNNGSNVNVGGDVYQAQQRNPVNTAIAPVVVTGSDQCLVPMTAGAQAITFGISMGTAARDKICEVIKMARLLEGMGDHDVALELLASDPRVAAAIKAVQDRKAGVKTSAENSATEQQHTALMQSQIDRNVTDNAPVREVTNRVTYWYGNGNDTGN